MKLGILSQDIKLYSTSRLYKTAKKRGHETEVVSYLRCYMNIAKAKPRIFFQGREINFDVVIPRIAATWTFYGAAVVRQFELMGALSANSSASISRSRDKLRALQLIGNSGEILVEPIKVKHGDIDALGFKIDKMAYIPDISDFYHDSLSKLYNLDILIIDALRRNPHPAHSHLENTLSWITELNPKKAILTNMHNDLDYETVKNETPANVSPAYDGMVINFQNW